MRKDVRSGRVQSQLSSTYFSGEREGGGGRDEDQVVGEERCQVREGPVTA